MNNIVISVRIIGIIFYMHFDRSRIQFYGFQILSISLKKHFLNTIDIVLMRLKYNITQPEYYCRRNFRKKTRIIIRILFSFFIYYYIELRGNTYV